VTRGRVVIDVLGSRPGDLLGTFPQVILGAPGRTRTCDLGIVARRLSLSSIGAQSWSSAALLTKAIDRERWLFVVVLASIGEGKAWC
jgi:hypothetical protein